jgi:hypothetical protein
MSAKVLQSGKREWIWTGNSKRRSYVSWFAGASLLPLTLGLGASVFVVFEHLFGWTAGTIFGLTFTAGSLLLLYGLGLSLRRTAGRKHNARTRRHTSQDQDRADAHRMSPPCRKKPLLSLIMSANEQRNGSEVRAFDFMKCVHKDSS